VSQKGRLRRLDAGVRWLETEGLYRRLKNMIKMLEMLQQLADRMAIDPAFAAKWTKDYPSFPWVLPPPSAHLRPRPPDPVVASPPIPVSSPPLPLPESEAPLVPEERPASVPPRPPREPEPAAPKPVEPPPVEPPPVEPRPVEPQPVEVMPGQPVSPPSPDMEIRPVRWRAREARDDDDRPGTNGKCITEYDPLADEDDDYDYDDDDDDG